jgi:hypothetical protein
MRLIVATIALVALTLRGQRRSGDTFDSDPIPIPPP